MPLETATYISDLVTSNPAGSDGMNNADDHLRLIKATLKATLPNFTAAPLQSTQAQIDGVVTTVATNGVSVLKDTGVFFKTNTADGFTNPAPGEVDIKVAGTALGQFNAGTTTFTVNGTLQATTALSGPGIVPIGGMIMWLTDTLPTDGLWCWANGGTLSRTGNGAALWAKWGSTYGPGDGVTTFNVINMQEAVPVGKSTMGGAASPGLLASIAAGVKAALGSLFGTDTRALATANLPPYTPSGSISVSGTTNITTTPTGAAVGSGGNTIYGISGANGSQNLGLSVSAQTFTGTAQGGTSTAFGIAQPSRVVNFIIRIG